jgi:transcriptional regulator with XRE-family HTH domain
MAPARQDISAMRSRLAERRIERNMSQAQLARYAGISLRTLVRLERKETENPPLRYLVNLSILLHCRVSDLIEDEWLEWATFTEGGPKRPPLGSRRVRGLR